VHPLPSLNQNNCLKFSSPWIEEGILKAWTGLRGKVFHHSHNLIMPSNQFGVHGILVQKVTGLFQTWGLRGIG
jgi:hypothetical protein